MASTALITYLGMALSLVSAPIVAQAIGADGRGIVAGSFALIQTLAWVGFVSLPRVLARESVGEAVLSRSALAWLSVLGVVNAGAVLALADVLSNGDERIALGMRVAAVVLVANGIGQVGVEQALAHGRIGLFNVSRLGYTVIPSLAIIVLSLTGALTTTTAYLATLVGQVVTTLVGSVLCFTLSARIGRASTPWKDSLHLWSASAIDGATGQLGQLLLAALSTAAQLGLFSIAVMLGSAAGALAQALTQVSYAKFIRDAGEDQGTSGQRLRQISLIGALSTVLAGVTVTIFVAVFGVDLFGPTFQGLAVVTAAAMVSQALGEQWSLRVLHDTAHRRVSRLVIASAAGATVTLLGAVSLGVAGVLDAFNMALALAAGAAVKILTRVLMRRYSR